MEKVRDWLGTPIAAVRTLIWLWWVSLLLAVFSGSLYLLGSAVQALFT